MTISAASKSISRYIESAKVKVTGTVDQMKAGYQYAGRKVLVAKIYVYQKATKINLTATQYFEAAGKTISNARATTAEAVNNFWINHNEKIISAGFAVASGYFAPHLFVSIAASSCILRIISNDFIKQKFTTCFNYPVNPFVNEDAAKFINRAEVVITALGFIAAVAFRTTYFVKNPTANKLIAFAALAAGNRAADIAINVTNKTREVTSEMRDRAVNAAKFANERVRAGASALKERVDSMTKQACEYVRPIKAALPLAAVEAQ